jgi:hypothetical protein
MHGGGDAGGVSRDAVSTSVSPWEKEQHSLLNDSSTKAVKRVQAGFRESLRLFLWGMMKKYVNDCQLSGILLLI